MLAETKEQQLPAGKATHANANNRGVRPAAAACIGAVPGSPSPYVLEAQDTRAADRRPRRRK